MITILFLILLVAVLNPIGQCLQLQDHLTDFDLEGYGGHKSHIISGLSDSSESSSNDSSDSNDLSTHAPEDMSIPKITDKISTEPPITIDTEMKVTDPPATDPPATDPPATDPPATDPPETDPPATDPPGTDFTATDPPATDPPATDPPATDPPVTDPPAETTDTPVEVADPSEMGIVDIIIIGVLNKLDLEGSTYLKYTEEEKQEFAKKVLTMIEEDILSEATAIGPDEQEKIVEVIIAEVVQKLENDSLDGAADKESVTETVRQIVNLILGLEVSGPELEVEVSVETGTKSPEIETEPATEAPEIQTEKALETVAPEIDTEEEVDEEELESMEKRTANKIATGVMEKVANYAEEKGPLNLPELDVSKVTGIVEAILAQIEKAVGEENMSEEVLQSQADNIADLIAANYIELDVSDESLQTEIEFDLSKIFDSIESVIKVQFELDREGESTESPTVALTESPTDAPTESPTKAPTPVPTEEPTESPTEEPTESPTEEPTEAPTEEPTEAPTAEPTEAPTEEPTEAPTAVPTEEPTESPTVSEAVVESIVTKASDKIKEYVDEGSINIDTDRISSIAEDVLSKFREEVGEDNVTEDMLEEQADKLAQLIANDFIELEVTEGGETIDMTGEGLMDIISTITDMTFNIVYEAASPAEITPSPTLPPTLLPTFEPTEKPTDSPTSSPTISDSVVQIIVKKAVDAVTSYVDEEGPISMPELDAEKVSSLAEDVLSKFREEVGEDNVTEDMLEEQADKLAQLIANDYLELEITEDGEPVDFTEEALMDIVSTITDVTFQIAYDAAGNR